MITITINIRDVMFQCAGLNMKRRKLSCIFSLKQQSSLDLKSQECLSLKFSLQQSKAYVQDCLSVHFFKVGLKYQELYYLQFPLWQRKAKMVLKHSSLNPETLSPLSKLSYRIDQTPATVLSCLVKRFMLGEAQAQFFMPVSSWNESVFS